MSRAIARGIHGVALIVAGYTVEAPATVIALAVIAAVQNEAAFG